VSLSISFAVMIYGSWVAAEPSGFFLSKAWKTINCEDVYEIGTFLFGSNALVVCSILFLNKYDY
jgi:hypothetical protein